MTAAALGGLVGTTFAIVTRYLRKWLLLAAPASSSDVSSALARPVLLASALFGALVSFSLPIRRRR